jgi:hypothetical protein
VVHSTVDLTQQLLSHLSDKVEVPQLQFKTQLAVEVAEVDGTAAALLQMVAVQVVAVQAT